MEILKSASERAREAKLALDQCSKGMQHAKMLLRVFVDRPTEFAAWVSAQQKAAVQDVRVSADIPA
jgi:cytochrome c oxidase subunit 2